MVCFHFSKKKNGGNQVLDCFYRSLIRDDCYKAIFLKNSFLKSLASIIKDRRTCAYVVSDPICAMLLGFVQKKNVIHFVQSDDRNLFFEKGVLFNLVYKFLYSIFIRKEWIRVFNSKYSLTCFEKNASTYNSTHSVVPMLGIRGLFPDNDFHIASDLDLNDKYLWVGSAHKFKGARIFAELIRESKSSGHMIFSGDIPDWILDYDEITSESNLERQEVLSRMVSCKAFVYTSSFDSFAMPVYEALFSGAVVYSLPSKCISNNVAESFVTTYDSEKDLAQALTQKSKLNTSLPGTIDWINQRKHYDDWHHDFKMKLKERHWI